MPVYCGKDWVTNSDMLSSSFCAEEPDAMRFYAKEEDIRCDELGIADGVGAHFLKGMCAEEEDNFKETSYHRMLFMICLSLGCAQRSC